MRRGDISTYFALNRLERLGKTLDKTNLSVIIEFKPADCSDVRWFAILKQVKAERNDQIKQRES